MTADGETMGMLMTRAQDGDRAAYRVLLNLCQRWLKRYYSRRVMPSVLDDLVQETMISLHRKRSSYDPTRPFLPWLAAIARYRWIDQLRRTTRAAETELDFDIAADSSDSDIVARLSLDRLLERLPERQSRVIRLVKIDGFSVADAAVMSGQSEPLVKVNIHRGLKTLAASIESE